MITYRELAEFLLIAIENEGRTDMQSHIGTMIAHEPTDGYLEEYFGAKLLVKTFEHFNPGQKCFYVYYKPGEDIFYMELAAVCFKASSELAVLETEDGTRIAIWAVSPEAKVVYEP